MQRTENSIQNVRLEFYLTITFSNLRDALRGLVSIVAERAWRMTMEPNFHSVPSER